MKTDGRLQAWERWGDYTPHGPVHHAVRRGDVVTFSWDSWDGTSQQDRSRARRRAVAWLAMHGGLVRGVTGFRLLVGEVVV